MYVRKSAQKETPTLKIVWSNFFDTDKNRTDKVRRIKYMHKKKRNLKQISVSKYLYTINGKYPYVHDREPYKEQARYFCQSNKKISGK